MYIPPPLDLLSQARALGEPYVYSALFVDRVDAELHGLLLKHSQSGHTPLVERLDYLRNLNSYLALGSSGVYDADRALPSRKEELTPALAAQTTLLANHAFHGFVNNLGAVNDNVTRAVAQMVGIDENSFGRLTRKQVRDLVYKNAPHFRDSFKKLENDELQTEINRLHNQIKHGHPTYRLCILGFNHHSRIRLGIYDKDLYEKPFQLEYLVKQYHGHTSSGVVDILREAAKLLS